MQFVGFFFFSNKNPDKGSANAATSCLGKVFGDASVFSIIDFCF